MKTTKTHKLRRPTRRYIVRRSAGCGLMSPVLQDIHTLAGQWHALYAAAKPERRFPKVRAEQLEERLESLWSRYRHHLAQREANRFQAIGERMFYTL
jgi:hypothetical protein